MRRSHTPPKCDPDGGLNSHLMFCKCSTSSNFNWLNLLISWRNSLLAPMKFVPSSDHMSLTGPRLALNLRMALMHASVSCEWAISKWAALLARHVKITPYLFITFLPSVFFWSKIIHSHSSKWWLVWCNPITWEICQFLFHRFALIFTAQNTFWCNSLNECTGSDDPILLSYTVEYS